MYGRYLGSIRRSIPDVATTPALTELILRDIVAKGEYLLAKHSIGSMLVTYNIQVASGGYVGWKFLERTLPRQRAAFVGSQSIRTSKEYFEKKMTSVTTVDEFVRDRKLMSVALRAFGLDEDMKNTHFIRKVLEANADDKTSLVNKLSDKRYLRLNQAFSLNVAASDNSSVDISSILRNFEDRSLEKNVGERFTEIELSLNARRELSLISRSETSENAKWYQILGSKALRKVFEGAFSLGDNFAALPMERQLSDFKEKNHKLIGFSDPSQFSAPDAIEKLVRLFLLRSKNNSAILTSPYAVSLAVLGYKNVSTQ